MYSIPIRTPLIDSLSLSFEIDKLTHIDDRITSTTSIYYNDLQAHEEASNPPKPLILEFNGIKLRFWLTTIPIYNADLGKKITTTFLNMTISAKLLKERYFEGINHTNIDYIYQNLLELGIFHIEYDTFLNGYAKDLDICVNDRMNQIHFDALISYLNDKTLLQKKHLVISTQERFNQGIQFNVRKYAKSLNPHFKLYNKELELLNKQTTIPFWNTYLFDTYKNQIKDLVRAEFTIKNYTHKRYLNNKGYIDTIPKTLQDFLKIPHKNYYNIISQEGLPNYLQNHKFIVRDDLSPTDTILLATFNLLVQHNYSRNDITSLVYNIQKGTERSTEVTQSRMRKKIQELLDIQQSENTQFDIQLRKNDVIFDYLLNGLFYKLNQ